MNDLDRLARDHGVPREYVSETGELRRVPGRTRRRLLELLRVDRESRVSAAAPEPARPERCYLPAFLRRGRTWGLGCQLYSLRSRRNFGIGDFEDLAALAEIAGAAGADFLGVSPMHALFPGNPEHASPYSPSSRQFLNVLFIAPDAEPEFRRSDAIERARGDARLSALIDYRAVAAVKLDVLRGMYRRFESAGSRARREAFDDFVADRGRPLADFALFEGLSARFDHKPWPEWPPGFDSPDSGRAREFAAAHADEVRFHAWLQWLADRQLARAQERALQAGQRIGLYVDLAVGVVGHGAAVWSRPDLMADGASIGAPPDPFNAGGQDWGLVPPRPNVLAAEGCRLFAEDLAASMRHAGAVRLDHVMALTRLYWIPEEHAAADGGYVHYPFTELADTVVRESRRHRVIVIGEALGTVPEGFLEKLYRRELQSYRVLFFEKRRDGGFRRPRAWPKRALACVSTHDLPTLQGWWTSRDLVHRAEAGMLNENGLSAARAMRALERNKLWEALAQQDLVNASRLPSRLGVRDIAAVHRYLARSRARLMVGQLEDALGITEQANLPGDATVHPNWRRKMPLDLEEVTDHELFRRVLEAVANERAST